MSVRAPILAVLCVVAIPVGLTGCREPLRANPARLEFRQEERVMETTFTNVERVNAVTVTESHKEGLNVERFDVENSGCVREESTVAANGGTCILRIRLVMLGGGNVLISLLDRAHKVVGSVVVEP